ncbi:hypothetical protein [Cumulibacter soli]|uniref:hypothetical protein n=1 Tax=Cumulibacter soli TaxID=2546344 RepID=UPI001067ADF4|nr:hypothetical protein [Cumulibacter soli]
MSAGQRMLQIIPEPIRGMLMPGEMPLTYELAQQFGQSDAIGREAPTLRNSVSWSFQAVLDPFGGPLEFNSDYIGAKVAGLTAGGAHGSVGHRFTVALEAPGATHLLLTTHRLAVVGTEFEKLLSMKQRDLIYFSVERAAVGSIQLAPRLFQRARVRIEFTDGSWAMAMMGMFFTRAANRFIAAHQQR